MRNLIKGNKISLVACGLLLSSSMAFGADSIDGAFKEGKVSGSIDAYYTNTDNDTSKDSGFSTAGVSLSYETGSYMGLSAKVGFVAASVLSEKEDGDADGTMDDNAILSEANITYSTDGFALTVGRQAIDLEWMGDYHEAAVAAITAVPDTTIVLGYTDKMAVAGIDEISSEFAKVNGTKGAYVADVKYTGFEGVELNPYYYSVPDIADMYGLKGTYTTDMFGITAQYAASSEDIAVDDGSIGHIELSTSIAGISAAAGYVKTDKDGGSGSVVGAELGDNISPFDSGNQVYGTDARTVYGSLGYSIAGVDLGLLYGETKYNSADYKEKELNVTVDYAFTDTLSTSLLYADINVDEAGELTKAVADRNVDNSYILAYLTYSF